MSRRKEHQRQHTVPKCYLDNFTDKNGSLWMFGPEMRIYKNAPQNTLTRDFYYNVTFNGKDSLIVEKGFLGTLEASYAEIYRNKISKHLPLLESERGLISIFIAAQLSRVPSLRDNFVDFINRIEDHIKPLMELPEKERIKFADPIPISHNPDDSISLDELVSFRENINSEYSKMLPKISIDLAPIIYTMKWGFMYFEGNNSFITSDLPVVMINPEAEKLYGVNALAASPGLLQKDVELSIPISSNIALLCGWKMTADGEYIRVNNKMVENINKLQINRASLIITNSESHSKALKLYIEKRKQLSSVRNVLRIPLEDIDTPIIE